MKFLILANPNLASSQNRKFFLKFYQNHYKLLVIFMRNQLEMNSPIKIGNQ